MSEIEKETNMQSAEFFLLEKKA